MSRTAAAHRRIIAVMSRTAAAHRRIIAVRSRTAAAHRRIIGLHVVFSHHFATFYHYPERKIKKSVKTSRPSVGG